VPNEIFQLPAVPRTLTCKKLELPIKKLLPGPLLDKIVTPDTMTNLESIAWYGEYALRRQQLT
jgi:acetoacetyl-CoA synthetase